jgi:hypothetical protein
MAFVRHDPIRCKITVDRQCLQHVKNFKYFGCEMSYENNNKKGYSTKIAQSVQIPGISKEI